MQSTFINIISYLQLCSAELLSYFVVIKVDSKAALTTILLTLFLLVKYNILNIASFILCLL